MQRHFSLNTEAFLKSLILLGFSTFLFWLVQSNKIIFYINPRFVRLTEAAAVLMFLMFLAQITDSCRRASTTHGYSSQSKIKLAFLPFVVTLLMAFLLPHSTLNASMSDNKGINLTRPVTSGQPAPPPAVPDNVPVTQTNNNSANIQGCSSQGQNPVQLKIDELRKSSLIKVTEDNFTIVTNEVNIYPDEFVGKEITMLGFVFKDQKLPPNQFGLVRYVISCCSADAVPDGFICEYANASNFSKGSWLNIRGTIQLGKYEGNTVPVIKISSFSKAPEPQNPYIYPVFYY